jgi:hypothetical protein
MKLFTGLKKIREFERLQLPFFRSLVDFDIIIEIGYAEEQGQPLTLKQLFLTVLTLGAAVHAGALEICGIRFSPPRPAEFGRVTRMLALGLLLPRF